MKIDAIRVLETTSRREWSSQETRASNRNNLGMVNRPEWSPPKTSSCIYASKRKGSCCKATTCRVGPFFLAPIVVNMTFRLKSPPHEGRKQRAHIFTFSLQTLDKERHDLIYNEGSWRFMKWEMCKEKKENVLYKKKWVLQVFCHYYLKKWFFNHTGILHLPCQIFSSKVISIFSWPASNNQSLQGKECRKKEFLYAVEMT